MEERPGQAAQQGHSPPGPGEPPSPPLTTVVQLGMSLTEFFTSSSVTSTTLQCSSSEGRGSSPFLVTQGCNCGCREGSSGAGPGAHSHPVGKGLQPFHQHSVRKPSLGPQPEPGTHTSQGRSLQKGDLAQPKSSSSPTLMSGTPILVSGFLSSIFRIRSLSSSLTSGLERGKEGDEGELVPPCGHSHALILRGGS